MKISRFNHFAATSLAAMALTSSVHAAAKTWSTSGTTVNFNLAGNWSALPASGDSLVFGADSAVGTTALHVLNNDLASLLSLSGITFNAGAPGYTLGGSAITLTGNVANNSTSLQTLGTAITTTAARTFTTTTGGGDIAVTGAISGTGGGVTKAGAGALTLSGINTYTGATTVSAGTLTLNRTTGSLAATALTFNGLGGTFNMDNTGASGALTQTLGALTFSAGEGTVKTTQSAAFDQALTFASLAVRTNGVIANFVLGGMASATNRIALTSTTNAPLTSESNNQGIFSGGSNYARYDATNGFSAVAYGTDTNALTAIGAATTIGATTSVSDVQVTGAISAQPTASVNTINLTSASAFTLGTGATLSVNGLLKTGGTAATISGGTALNTTASGGELVIRTDAAGDILTLSTPVLANGASTLAKSGLGTLVLSGANTYTGVTTINAGTLQAGSANALSSSSAATLVNTAGALLDLNNLSQVIGSLAGGGTAGGNVTMGSATLTVGDNTSTTYSGMISGTAGLTKTGTGTLNLGTSLAGVITSGSTVNLIGGVTIKAGTFGLVGPIGAGNITIGDTAGGSTAAATLNMVGLGTNGVVPSYTNAIVLGATSGTLSITAGTSGQLSFTGGITGANNLTIAENSTGTGTITFLTGSVNNTGTFTNAGTGASGTGVTISSAIGSNVTGVIQNGTTTLSLTGANAAFIADTTVTTGKLNLQNINSLQKSVLNMNGGSVTLGTSTTLAITSVALGGISGSVNINLNNTLTVPTAVNLILGNSNASYGGNTLNPTYSGVLSNTNGAATLTKVGSNTQALTGANTYSGATTVSVGTLDLGGGTATGSIASTVFNLGGGTLAYTRTGNTTQAFTTTNITAGSSAVTAVAGDTLTLGTLVPVAGGTVNFGTTGTITTSTANDATGILGGWATFGGTTWAVANGAGSAITGLASFTTDTWALGNNVDVTTTSAPDSGSTANSLRFNTAAANTLTLAGTNILTAGGILVTPTVGNNLTTITGGNLSGAASADLVVVQNNPSNGLTIASIIADNGGATGLAKSGAGLLTLTATNTYTGATTIGAGTLQIGTAGRLGTAGSYAGNIVNNGTLQYSSSAAQTLSGIISGTGSVTKDTSSSTLTLSGVNTFSGGLFINSGTVSLGTSATAGGAGSITIGTAGSANATLSLGGNLAIANPIILGGSIGTMSITQASSNTTSITGGLTGTGNLSFNKSNNGGVFQFTTGILNNTGTITIAYDRTSRVDITSAIGSAVQGLTLNSPTGTTGSLTLSAANTNFIGDTTLTAGTLNLQNTNALQNSVLNMNGGAVTLGTSTAVAITSVALGGLSGSVNINLNNFLTVPTAVNLTLGNSNASYGGNTLNPTYSGVLSNTNGAASLTKVGSNTQTLSGANTYTGATTVSAGTLALASGSTASPITVHNAAFLGFTVGSPVTSTSTLTLDSGAKIKLSGVPVSPASYTLITASGGISGTPVLDAAIPGYTLAVESGNTVLKLNYTGGGGSNYASWANDPAKGNIPGEPATGDFDNDGLSNLTEYALGKNPRTSDQPAGGLAGSVLTYTKGADAIANGDVSWVIETSESLAAGDWSTAVTQAAGDPALTITYTFTPGTPAKKFARLKVTQN